MTIARRRLVDPSVTRWYHCITCCVRRAHLFGEGASDRKTWIENRLEELAQLFAVGIGGFSIMDNHLHVLVRLDPEVAQSWSDEDVIRRWGRLYPPRDRSRRPVAVSDAWVQEKLAEPEWIATARQRLQSVSWFMKSLKEPLARLANREDDVRGTFFEGRFKSIAILDEAALLAISAYVDLNPVAARIAEVPETSEHTSIKVRADNIKAQGATAQLESAKSGSVPGSRDAGGLEERLWLCPIEDRRRFDSAREGMFDGLSIGSYLLLVDYTGRLFREGKARISEELAGIFDRMRGTSDGWLARMEKLRNGRLRGRFFTTSRERLMATARLLKVRRCINLGGCVAS